MLVLAISSVQQNRKKSIQDFLQSVPDIEIIRVDDSVMTIIDLEQYVFPSLFSQTTPVIHATFLLESTKEELEAKLFLQLVQSPTIFLFEELVISAPHLRELKKAGATVLLNDEKKVGVKKVSPLFGAVTILCTSTDRRQVWLCLQEIFTTESPEALLGMMYWKLRDLITKDKRKQSQYKKFYQELLAAHAQAWQKNIPLSLQIEKVLLEKNY